MTIAQVISDPLIAMLNDADGINTKQFSQLLESASRVLFPKGT
jgi:hypothetical protein